MNEMPVTTPTPPAPTTPPDQTSREDLETQKLAIEADPDFLSRYRDPARNSLLVKQWNDIHQKLHAVEQASPTPAPAHAPPVSLIPLPASPEGEWSPEVVTTVNEYVQSVGTLGMPPEEARRWLHYAGEQLQADPPNPEETVASLKIEWGADFSTKLEAARLATEKLGERFKTDLNATGLGDDVRVIRRMAELGASLVSAAARKRGIEANPHFLDKWKDPELHAKLVADWNRAFQELNPKD